MGMIEDGEDGARVGVAALPLPSHQGECLALAVLACKLAALKHCCLLFGKWRREIICQASPEKYSALQFNIFSLRFKTTGRRRRGAMCWFIATSDIPIYACTQFEVQWRPVKGGGPPSPRGFVPRTAIARRARQWSKRSPLAADCEFFRGQCAWSKRLQAALLAASPPLVLALAFAASLVEALERGVALVQAALLAAPR
jgi:hypothetical protein